jgi:leucyl-tRNA synthetase
MTDFWITNVSNMNVSLSDLGITVPAGRSWNLLDSKHFKFTLEQLEKSNTSGSIFKKRDKIRHGTQHHQVVKNKKELSTQPIQIRKRSAVKIDNSKFDEGDWMFSDEQFAEEMSKDGE